MVRNVLRSMCRGPNRCMYCVDSSADQIDHFRPKDFYPDRVFDWGNYIWSCGRCNRRKSNRFSIIRAAAKGIVEVRRGKRTPPIPPPKGRPAYWNPRRDDPLHHMMLDLRDTFEFVAIDAAGTINFERTRQTIKALGLNDRDDLVKAREDAFRSYRARLHEYVAEKGAAGSQIKMCDLKDALLRMPHPTVWAEIVRQRKNFPVLAQLFDAAPEAVDW